MSASIQCHTEDTSFGEECRQYILSLTDRARIFCALDNCCLAIKPSKNEHTYLCLLISLIFDLDILDVSSTSRKKKKQKKQKKQNKNKLKFFNFERVSVLMII